MKLAVYGPNIPGALQRKGTFHIHAADCADRKRRPWSEFDDSGEASWELDAADKVEVCDAVYTPGEFECRSGDYLYDFHFYPCCAALPIGELKPEGYYEEVAQ